MTRPFANGPRSLIGDLDRLAVLEVGDAGARAERQRRMRGGERVLIVDRAAARRLAVEARAVPRGDAASAGAPASARPRRDCSRASSASRRARARRHARTRAAALPPHSTTSCARATLASRRGADKQFPLTRLGVYLLARPMVTNRLPVRSAQRREHLAPASSRPTEAIARPAARTGKGKRHVRPLQVEHDQAQEGAQGLQARQDLHQADQGDHGRGAHGRRRHQRQPAPAHGGHDGASAEHAERQHRPRHQEGHRRARGRDLRGGAVRGLRPGRRRDHALRSSPTTATAPSPRSATSSASTAATSARPAASAGCSRRRA